MSGAIWFVLADALPAGVTPEGATFALVHVDGLLSEVLATDTDVPSTVYPETFAAELAAIRGAVWDVRFRQRDLLYSLRPDGVWRAQDSMARYEEEPIPAGCRYLAPGEVGDFVFGAVPEPAGVA